MIKRLLPIIGALAVIAIFAGLAEGQRTSPVRPIVTTNKDTLYGIILKDTSGTASYYIRISDIPEWDSLLNVMSDSVALATGTLDTSTVTGFISDTADVLRGLIVQNDSIIKIVGDTSDALRTDLLRKDAAGDTVQDIAGVHGFDSLKILYPQPYSTVLNFADWVAYPGYHPDNDRDSIIVTATPCTVISVTGHQPGGNFYPGVIARGDSGDIHLDSLQSISIFSPPYSFPAGVGKIDSIIIYVRTSAGTDSAGIRVELFRYDDGTLTQLEVTTGPRSAWNDETEATTWATSVNFNGTFTGNELTRYDQFMFRLRLFALNNAEYVQAVIQIYWGR